MTEVRIRAQDWSKPLSLGDVPLLDLDSVIPMIKQWGLEVDRDYKDTDDLFGQFVVDDSGAYFEVRIGD